MRKDVITRAEFEEKMLTKLYDWQWFAIRDIVAPNDGFDGLEDGEGLRDYVERFRKEHSAEETKRLCEYLQHVMDYRDEGLEGITFTTAVAEPMDRLKISERYLDRQRKYRERHGLEEEEIFLNIIREIERITGPLLEWQKTYALAAISGRGVEWAQTRGGTHYHIMGLSCPICGRI